MSGGTSDERRTRIAVSGCLLGEAVRYDGGHRASDAVTERLGGAFELVSECPEVGLGLGVPRPKIRLERQAGGVRLLGSRDEDLTSGMEDYAAGTAARLESVAGLVLKARSPSCGLGDVKVHEGDAVVSETGHGVFAGGLAAALPALPRISEAGLDDPARRDHWLTRVFAFEELRVLAPKPSFGPANDHPNGRPAIQRLLAFHARWKVVLLAHSETTARRLGRQLGQPPPAAADSGNAFPAYRDAFLAGLAEPASAGSHENALLHLFGHLKKRLPAPEKARLLAEIAAFRAREAPLAVPVRSLADWGARLGVATLADQAYLAARPASLGYREQIYNG